MTFLRLIRVLAAALLVAVPSVAAGADWRDDIGAFRVGILAGQDIQAAIARAEPFRLALEEGLGVTVDIFPARDYAALIDASAGSRIEYAVFSATAYALAWNRCECIEPLVVARSGDGTQGVAEAVIARRTGPASLAELEGRRIAAVRAPAFGGLEIALRQMQAQGFDPGKGGTVIDMMAHGEAAIAAFRDGRADALIGWSSMTGDPSAGYSRGTLTRIAALEGGASDYRVIWQSTVVPFRVHAVRNSLPAEARNRLRELLSAMFDNDPVAYDSIEPVHGGGFVPARQGQFGALAELLARDPPQTGQAGNAEDPGMEQEQQGDPGAQ